MATCSICVQNKSKPECPSGLLQTLSTLHRLCSHISPDFVLLLVMGNILSVVDRFSKSTHFIPREKLSNAVENAKLLINHVFKLPLLQKECLIGVPNSSLKYGKLSALRAKACLSSSFHSQTNGQTERLVCIQQPCAEEECQ